MAWETVLTLKGSYQSYFLNKNDYRYRLINNGGTGSPEVEIKEGGSGGFSWTTRIRVEKVEIVYLDDFLKDRSSGTYEFRNYDSPIQKFELQREVKNSAPTTTSFTTPQSGTVLKSESNVKVEWNPSSDPEGDAISYALEVSVNNSNYQILRDYSPSTGFSYTVPEASTVRFRVTAKDSRGAVSGYAYSETFNVIINKAPTLTLSTENDKTLYEENILDIKGQALDQDSGNIISVKYRIDNESIRTIDAKVSDGSTPLSFAKNLIFKQSKFYDGTTAITGVLAEGIAHTLTVWSEDDQGGKSANAVRTFQVVPNKPPSLVINAQSTKDNLINKDTVTISGSVSDPENESVIVTYSLNGANPIEVHNGSPGNWSFNLQLKNLTKGDNAVIIEVTDNYGAKAKKTLKVTKTHNTVPLKNAVATWKINPPIGSAKEVLAWIQRELGDLAINTKISMTAAGEQENFAPMNLTNTAPVNESVTEDEFSFINAAAKENIILKVELSRTNTDSQQAIKLISGVLE